MKSKASAPKVPASVFEALYVRALKADDHLKAILLEHKVDLDRLADSYPSETMVACLKATSRQLFPDRSLDESFRLLGRAFADGFRATIVGSVLVAALPTIGPDRIMKRLPKVWTFGQDFGRAAAEQLGPKRWRFRYDHSEHPTLPANGQFAAGAIESALRWSKVEPKVEVLKDEGPAYELEVSWL